MVFERASHVLLNHIRYNFINLNSTIKQRLGLNIDELILKCSFKNGKCTHSDFEWIYHFKYGNCFIFNHNNSYKLLQGGKENGLALTVFSGIEELMPLVKSSGFVIYVFNQSENLDFFYYFKKVYLKPNGDYELVISPNFVEKLKKPYSACEIGSLEDIQTLKYARYFTDNSLYRRLFCLQLVLRQQIFIRCGCMVQPGDVPGHNETCTTVQQTACSNRIYETEFLVNRFDSVFDQTCPMECNFMYYTYTSSSRRFPSTYYARHLKRKHSHLLNTSILNIQNSVAYIEVYYQTLESNHLTEIQTMTIVDLISGTGGMLGLFMGMSFLSFVEIFEFITEISLLVCKMKPMKKVHVHNVKKIYKIQAKSQNN